MNSVEHFVEQAKASVPVGLTTEKWIEVYNQKFAELIVKECCQTVERRYKYSNGTPMSFWEMSQDVQDLLKKHFGVE